MRDNRLRTNCKTWKAALVEPEIRMTHAVARIIQEMRMQKPQKTLMRARYSAYATSNLQFLAKSLPLLHRKDFDRKSAKDWSEKAEWTGLEIISTKDGSSDDDKGVVEFVAHFKQGENELRHHEVAEFEKMNGRWYFVDGKIVEDKEDGPVQAYVPKNAPCPCNSGKKFKRCCGA